ncbi:MAG: bud neck involved protein [Thelocarpon superellum]|nr:MAG: bud neck involved protein [Thelocarpon superellum]
MLQPRPSSASGTFQTGPQGHTHPLHNPRAQAMPRNMYAHGAGGVGNYRGQTSPAAVVPYTFSANPGLNQMHYAHPSQFNPHHLRQENRTFSAPVLPYNRPYSEVYPGNGHQRLPTNGSVSTTSSASSSAPATSNEDASAHEDAPTTATPGAPSQSAGAVTTPSMASVPQMALIVPSQPTTKPSPDRYRRVQRRAETSAAVGPAAQQQAPVAGASAVPSGSGMATVGHLYGGPAQTSGLAPTFAYQSFGTFPQRGPRRASGYGSPISAGAMRPTSMDDMQLYRQPQSEQAKRYRRRSISSLDVGDFAGLQRSPQSSPVRQDQMIWTGPITPARPASSHRRSGSSDSNRSGQSAQAKPTGKRESGMTPFKPLTPTSSSPTAAVAPQSVSPDSRTSSTPSRALGDGNKRVTAPSPLSRPLPPSPESASSKPSFVAPRTPHPTSSGPSQAVESAATQQLHALNDKQAKKGGKSRLRRAFSFGSAAELRKASAENNMNNAFNERAKLRKDRYEDEQEAQQAAIAQQQEEGGIGESIYSSQGNYFTGSTDNLSISSTASSASVMIRKMGKGMKKSTRSLVGLFRPKSTVGPPASEEGAQRDSLAQVSMVTVEAEREKVNVNVDPHDQIGGGTGYPRLERNSIDAAVAAAGSSVDSQRSSREGEGSDGGRSRRSIVGGDRERADILAAVKKGILKRTGADSGSSSPVVTPADSRTADFTLPNIPLVSDSSPHSSAPSTPRDDRASQGQLGHRRTDSVTIEGEDYFMSPPKFGFHDSKSAPGTPQSMAKYNVSFSPRIQFHDTWTSGEYDRRGEIATCNRLTPMLAQQIKEELNSFKMEMEVHEHSKVYTHFF